MLNTKQQELDKANAIEWAKSILLKDNVAILDTETTDFNGYICDIAIMDLNGNVLLDTLINPMAEINYHAYKVHGLSIEQLVAKPVFSDITNNLIDIFSKYHILIYNKKFDLAIIKNEIHRMYENQHIGYKSMSNVFLKIKSDCLMWKYAAYRNELNEKNPQSVFGLNYKLHKLNGGHRALMDVQKSLVFLKEMASLKS